METRDTRTHILSFLTYPDRTNLYVCNTFLYGDRTSLDAFKHAQTLVHRPWVSPGRCVMAGCNRIKCTSYLDGVAYTISNYCWGHCSGHRATTIQAAYLMQPDWFYDAYPITTN